MSQWYDSQREEHLCFVEYLHFYLHGYKLPSQGYGAYEGLKERPLHGAVHLPPNLVFLRGKVGGGKSYWVVRSLWLTGQSPH